MTSTTIPPLHQVLAETRAWVDEAVIGLNLCPFAKAVQVKGQVRYVASPADTAEALRAQLADELRLLAATAAEQVETTVLVHPHVLQDFLDYNDFLDVADALLEELELDGELQVASFHPDYAFAGEDPDGPGPRTNRSPYPTLHLIREASIDRAVAAFPDADAIWRTNQHTMEQLGDGGWQALRARCEAAGRQAATGTAVTDGAGVPGSASAQASGQNRAD
ncbi:MAG: hypothetical protein RLY78_45 [Pseudomonadota bacterium]|jgi:hypothetical protein